MVRMVVSGEKGDTSGKRSKTKGSRERLGNQSRQAANEQNNECIGKVSIRWRAVIEVIRCWKEWLQNARDVLTILEHFCRG